MARGTEGDVSGDSPMRVATDRDTVGTPAITQLLKEIFKDRNGDRAVEARGVLAQVDLKFVGLWKLTHRLE